MNHHPIYEFIAPAFCVKPGDTCNPDAPTDCKLCPERLARKDLALRQEHFHAASQMNEIGATR